MIKKRILACGIMVALTFGIPAVGNVDVYATDNSYEYEENDSYEAANYINLEQSVTGVIEKSDDVDYYMVSPNADGKIGINFCHTYVASSDDWNVYVYVYEDGQYTELSAINIDLNSNEKIKLPDVGAVKSGTYYVKVEKCCSRVVGEKYTIQTSFTASNYVEKEVNNIYASATDMTPNSSYNGTINNSSDEDYYKIVAPENGKIMLSFNHVFIDSSDDWNVYVYMYEDGQYTELSANNIDLNSNEKIKLPDVGAVRSGIYYVKVEKCCSGVVGENYTIQTSFKASDYIEKEVNDTYALATEINFNRSYSGNINKYGDKDYYKIVAPESGMMRLAFGHTFENSYDDWNVYIYRYSNGEYTEISNANIDLNANNTIYFPSVVINKNGIYYVKVEKCCSGVIGHNYSLKASYYVDIPSSLSVKTSKNTAKLSWSRVYGAAGYEVYYKVGKNGKYKKLTSTTKTSYSYKKLIKGKTYYFKVRAYKKEGTLKSYSAFSKSRGVTRR